MIHKKVGDDISKYLDSKIIMRRSLMDEGQQMNDDDRAAKKIYYNANLPGQKNYNAYTIFKYIQCSF